VLPRCFPSAPSEMPYYELSKSWKINYLTWSFAIAGSIICLAFYGLYARMNNESLKRSMLPEQNMCNCFFTSLSTKHGDLSALCAGNSRWSKLSLKRGI
jgi:hypothetical protein